MYQKYFRWTRSEVQGSGQDCSAPSRLQARAAPSDATSSARSFYSSSSSLLVFLFTFWESCLYLDGRIAEYMYCSGLGLCCRLRCPFRPSDATSPARSFYSLLGNYFCTLNLLDGRIAENMYWAGVVLPAPLPFPARASDATSPARSFYSLLGGL